MQTGDKALPGIVLAGHGQMFITLKPLVYFDQIF